jgi:hypothetical protein
MCVLRELLVSWPREGPESDALIGLDILNEALCENREGMEQVE